MVSFTDKWNALKNNEKLTQAFMGKVKPDAPLKNRLDAAQKKLQLQISKLSEIDTKLQQKNDAIFEKIVSAKKSNDEDYARIYANELSEIRKHKQMVGNAKLSMEQIKLRLSTVSELGDIVVTLSPCMSLIKGLAPSISALMPQMHSSMENLTSTLGDMITDSSITHESITPTYQGNEETDAILKEAHDVLEGRTLSSIPEPPNTPLQSFSKEKESMI